MTYPRNFSHIGITVTDLDKAVEFYTKVMGWYLIMPATTITEDDSAIGVMCNDVFGPGWGSFRIAHLSTGDKIGIELFEFPNSEQRENNFEFWKTGCSTSACRIRMSRGWRRASSQRAASSGCRCASTTRARSLTAWSTWRFLRQHHRDLQPQL